MTPLSRKFKALMLSDTVFTLTSCFAMGAICFLGIAARLGGH